MRTLTKDELKSLIQAGSDLCVSLYLKTARAGKATLEGPIRFRGLLRAAWEKVEPRFRQCRQLSAAAAEAGLAMGRATDQLDKAVAAACQGRADKCFVLMNEQRWGTFHSETATIERLDRRDRHGCDLLDYAAVQTLLHGGETFPIKTLDCMPGHAPLVVQFRF